MRALAERYATALVEAGLELGVAEQVKKELRAFTGLLQESTDLVNVLASPAVPKPSKQAVVEKLVRRLGASRTLRNFLFVIVDHRRSALLPEILPAYELLLNARLGITVAEVISAEELGLQEKTKLTGVLEKLTRMRVEARYLLDPALIAGAVVRIGSTIYDGSVRQQLERLRAQLATD